MSARMTRSAVDHVLTRDMGIPKARLFKGKRYDSHSAGWRLQWSRNFTPFVTYEVGHISVAHHPDPDGTVRAGVLAQVAAVLEAAGYRTTTDDRQVRIEGPA